MASYSPLYIPGRLSYEPNAPGYAPETPDQPTSEPAAVLCQQLPDIYSSVYIPSCDYSPPQVRYSNEAMMDESPAYGTKYSEMDVSPEPAEPLSYEEMCLTDEEHYEMEAEVDSCPSSPEHTPSPSSSPPPPQPEVYVPVARPHRAWRPWVGARKKLSFGDSPVTRYQVTENPEFESLLTNYSMKGSPRVIAEYIDRHSRETRL